MDGRERSAAQQGFLHPEGVYDDPNGGASARGALSAARYHFQFHNELKLFAEIDHHDDASV